MIATKPPARIITTAWGDQYINNLLSRTVPALLAPGNLPTLAEHFSCKFVLVTEESLFGRIHQSDVWQKLGEFCQTQLIPVDDLIAATNHYGISLTHALMRGFEDLGSQMVNCYLLFLNADFILADGSYRTLTAKMLAGERLIHAPSYCVVSQNVVGGLDRRFDREHGTLSILPREMAGLILSHRHYTIRAKTVNQRLFRMHRFDQFYWQVDNYALLCRQLPIALVCMKPERVVAELDTFWDYGVISEFCPTIKPCILGDSDDFLMLELRDENAFQDLFRLGWASVSEIASDLSSFTTKDHRDSGQHTLIVHDRDLPLTLESARREFEAFMDEVYRELSPDPVHHCNHAFWASDYAIFKRRRADYLVKKRGDYVAETRISLSHHSKGLLSKARRIALPNSVYVKDLLGNARERSHEMYFRLVGLSGELYGRWVGRVPFVKAGHPFHSVLCPMVEIVEAAFAQPGRNVLMVATRPGSLMKYVKTRFGNNHTLTDGTALASSRGDRLSTDLSANVGTRLFDLCLCEIELPDLLRFDKIFRRILPFMNAGGQVVVFYLNQPFQDLQKHKATIIRHAMLPVGSSCVTFSGSGWIKVIIVLYNFVATLRTRYGFAGFLAQVGCILAATPLVMVGNLFSRKEARLRMPRYCLSLTIDFHLF